MHKKQLAHVVILLVYKASKKKYLFFCQNCNYNYNEFYVYHGYFLYKVEIIFPESLHYQHTFSTFV
jgi:hypothetical protein